MTSNHEDTLRRVLSEQAASVLPAADAWPKIHAGAQRRHRTKRWLQYGGATAGATAAIVTVILVANNRTAFAPEPVSTGQVALASTAAATASKPVVETHLSIAASALPPAALPLVPGRLGKNFAAVVQDRVGAQLVLVSKQDGTIAKWLTPLAGVGGVSAPTASPDGKYVYYLRHGKSCDAGVYRVPTSGGAGAKVVDLKQSIIAYALNGQGTRIAALRYEGCGTSAPATILVEYDVATGKQTRRLDLPAVAKTVPTAIAWHPSRPELAIVRSGQDGKQDSVSVIELPESSRSPVGDLAGLPPCFSGGVRHIGFSGDLLYVGADCVDRETASRHGRILVAQLTGASKITAELRVTTLPGQAIAGLYVDAASGGIVYATVRWGEESLDGPTSLHQQGPTGGGDIFKRPAPSLLLGLAW